MKAYKKILQRKDMILKLMISFIFILKTDGAYANEAGEYDVCLTPGCVVAAARILKAMDTSVNPCDNFYNFACGSWIKNRVIPEHKSSLSSFSEVEKTVDVTIKGLLEAPNQPDDPISIQKARNYYKLCIDQDAIEKNGLYRVKQLIEKFGGWPVLESNDGGRWDERRFNLEDLLVETERHGQNMPLIRVGVTKDLKSASNNIIYVSSASLGMASREYYLKEDSDKYLSAYRKMLEESYMAFGADPEVAVDAANDVVDFETEIANITATLEETRDLKNTYHKTTVAKLMKKYHGVDWMKLINGTMSIVETSINESEQVLDDSPDYFEKLGNILGKYPSRVIANYVVGRITLRESNIFYYPKTLKDIYFRFKKVFTGTSKQSSRWKSCANKVKEEFQEVVGRLFVQAAFGQEAQKDVLELVENLRSTFKHMVDNATWLDESTKQTAKEKAELMEPLIGYPAITFNTIALDTYYENVTIFNEDAFRTKISMDQTSNVRYFQKLRHKFDKTRWFMSAATVNAYNYFLANQMVYPAAILQPPLYSYDQPEYLNYGGIGSVIGHEITHGFDDMGRHFDKYGQMVDWWTDNDEVEYNKRKMCLVDQYSNFTVPGTDGMKVNGVLTVGENIADNGGSRESFMAYRNWVRRNRQGKEEKKLPGLDYTPNQLFYLNEAQTYCCVMRKEAKIKQILTDSHSFPMFRVIGPLQNSEDFSKAWNCPVGSYMNPPIKCSVW